MYTYEFRERLMAYVYMQQYLIYIHKQIEFLFIDLMKWIV